MSDTLIVDRQLNPTSIPLPVEWLRRIFPGIIPKTPKDALVAPVEFTCKCPLYLTLQDPGFFAEAHIANVERAEEERATSTTLRAILSPKRLFSAVAAAAAQDKLPELADGAVTVGPFPATIIYTANNRSCVSLPCNEQGELRLPDWWRKGMFIRFMHKMCLSQHAVNASEAAKRSLCVHVCAEAEPQPTPKPAGYVPSQPAADVEAAEAADAAPAMDMELEAAAANQAKQHRGCAPEMRSSKAARGNGKLHSSPSRAARASSDQQHAHHNSSSHSKSKKSSVSHHYRRIQGRQQQQQQPLQVGDGSNGRANSSGVVLNGLQPMQMPAALYELQRGGPAAAAAAGAGERQVIPAPGANDNDDNNVEADLGPSGATEGLDHLCVKK